MAKLTVIFCVALTFLGEFVLANGVEIQTEAGRVWCSNSGQDNKDGTPVRITIAEENPSMAKLSIESDTFVTHVFIQKATETPEGSLRHEAGHIAIRSRDKKTHSNSEAELTLATGQSIEFAPSHRSPTNGQSSSKQDYFLSYMELNCGLIKPKASQN